MHLLSSGGRMKSFPESFGIFHLWGERFGCFDVSLSDLTRVDRNVFESFTSEGERFGERFKSHKCMKNNIDKKNNNNLSPIHPTPTRATRDTRVRIGSGVKGKDSVFNGSFLSNWQESRDGNGRSFCFFHSQRAQSVTGKYCLSKKGFCYGN